jgi:predicted dehydrogenase
LRCIVGHRFRILLIGYGARGREWHRACGDRRDLTLVGVIDPDASARAAAERAGLPAWPTLEAAAGPAGADRAIVASPPAGHVEQALACLELGLPVLVEKPLALALAEAARLTAASGRLGLPVLVGQNFRFLPRERAVRKALLALGPPFGANIVSARPASAAAPHLAGIEHGPVWDICLHHLDALRVRFGSTPQTVAMSVREAGAESRRRYRIELEWPGGVGVVYEHSEGAPGFFHEEWIEGARSAIVVRDQQASILFDGRRPRPVSVPRGPVPEQALLDALLDSDGPEASALGALDNLATIAIVEAAVRSAALAEPVEPAAVAGRAGVEILA